MRTYVVCANGTTTGSVATIVRAKSAREAIKETIDPTVVHGWSFAPLRFGCVMREPIDDGDGAVVALRILEVAIRREAGGEAKVALLYDVGVAERFAKAALDDCDRVSLSEGGRLLRQFAKLNGRVVNDWSEALDESAPET